MKFISALLLLFAAHGLMAADFSVEADYSVKNTEPGKTIPVTLKLKCPEGYRPAAWIITVFRPDVPSAFPEALGLEKKFSKAKRPEWSYCQLSVKWFLAKDMTMTKEVRIETTPKWPCGDYRLLIQVLFRKKGATAKADKYISAPVLFTLEKPAEPADKPAETPKQAAE
ncbi:MAG: hypothetical protein IJS14_01750 [Lentisphaeria bacterium]|nr:hypothetical protein [Lentisphaeria bacterium]